MSIELSVVVPLYKSAQTLPTLLQRIDKARKHIPGQTEIILVDDGSPDDGLILANKLSSYYSGIKIVKLSKNFGQHIAILAGLDNARGKWTVVMDADLQDPPEAIIELWDTASTGEHSIIYARREGRKDTWLDRISSRLFYKMIKKFTGQDFSSDFGNFGIYSREVIETVRELRESNFFFPIAVRWTGFSSSEIKVHRQNREDGQSSYSFIKRMKLGLNVLIVNTNYLLKLSVNFGALISTLALLASLVLAVSYFIGGVEVAGWTSVIVSVYLMSGFLLMSIGVMGLYIGRIHEIARGRPLYVKIK